MERWARPGQVALANHIIKSYCILSKSGIRDLDVWLKIPSGTEESEAVAVTVAAAFSVALYEEEVRPSVGRG